MIEKFRALGDENRLRIINILMEDELCVCELEVLLLMNQSNVSRHLTKLRNCNLISSNKEAQWVHYKTSKAFNNDDVELLHYLLKEFEKYNIYKEDLERLNKYKLNEFNCQIIKNNRKFVLEKLREEN